MSNVSLTAGLQQLLKVQEHDSTIDRLGYSREHLPAHAQLAEIQLEAGVLRSAMNNTISQRDDARRQQQELETEIAALDKRIKEINDRLYGETQVAAKDAQAMSAEVKHFEERRNALEDRELEVMEMLEPLEIEVSQRQGQAEVLAERARVATAEVEAGQGEIEVQLQLARAEREAAAAPVPELLTAEYEKLRAKLGGVGVARLNGASCGGCHLTMSAQEVDRVRRSIDAVSHCDECGRILVP